VLIDYHLWIRPEKPPINRKNLPFPCGYDRKNLPIAARIALSGAGSSLLKTFLRKNDLKNGGCVASSQRRTCHPYGYPRAGALGWPMRPFGRIQGGLARTQKNARPRPVPPAFGVPLVGGTAGWSAPAIVVASQSAGDVPSPPSSLPSVGRRLAPPLGAPPPAPMARLPPWGLQLMVGQRPRYTAVICSRSCPSSWLIWRRASRSACFSSAVSAADTFPPAAGASRPVSSRYRCCA